jgi:hypothetical protein
MSGYQALGLPESVQHTLFAIALLLFLSPYLFGLDLGFIKVPDLRRSGVDMRYIGPVVLAAALLGYARLWRSDPEPDPSRSKPLAWVEREKLRFGLTLGWQLGRFEFVDGSSFAEARAAEPSIRAEIEDLLSSDHYPKPVAGLSYRELMRTTLLHYAMVDLEKHGAILVGVAAMRASLIGASSTPGHNEEMSQLAYSAILEADDSIIPDKRSFFERLVHESPGTVMDLIRTVVSHCR